jgi:hypothetical protein
MPARLTALLTRMRWAGPLGDVRPLDRPPWFHMQGLGVSGSKIDRTSFKTFPSLTVVRVSHHARIVLTRAPAHIAHADGGNGQTRPLSMTARSKQMDRNPTWLTAVASTTATGCAVLLPPCASRITTAKASPRPYLEGAT